MSTELPHLSLLETRVLGVLVEIVATSFTPDVLLHGHRGDVERAHVDEPGNALVGDTAGLETARRPEVRASMRMIRSAFDLCEGRSKL